MVLITDLVLTWWAIATENIVGCLFVIAYGILINKYGSPVLLENYLARRKVKQNQMNEYIAKKRRL